MTYEIEETAGTLKLILKNVGQKKKELITIFQNCGNGKCKCPTGENKKLSDILINSTENDLYVTFKLKEKEKLDLDSLGSCLKSVVQKLGLA